MKKRFLEGIVKRHPDGFGFLVPDDTEHPDVYIPRHSMNGVMTNDRVMIEVFPEKGDQRFRGEIVRVTKRYFTEVLGRFHTSEKSGGALYDEGHGWGQSLLIKPENTHRAQDGDYVRVQITSYPNQRDGLIGRVIEVLGKHGDPLLDVKKVIFQHKLPHEFSPTCEKEANELPQEVRAEDMKGRRDLTQKKFITIDGATAKDFDDAVYSEQTDKGFRLWVAIADVSHYVKSGRPMDKDAYERGTSTYFPNFVVPMLPEKLSNELCSLKPNVIRLSLVAEMLISFTGDLLESVFYEAFIKSHARVTYGEAQEVIDGNEIEKIKHVRDTIIRASDLAKILLAKRTRDGSLQLEIGETEIVLNDLGEPVDIIRAERLFAHKVIEELMLIANVAVAKFFAKNEIDAIYRIHEAPHQDSIRLLSKYMEAFGGKGRLSGGSLQKRLTKALSEFQNTPQEEVINVLTLRAMNQAQYSPDNVGHFGLGFSHYTHFTSPIRRYPDLIVHRLLKSLILKSDQYQGMSLEDLSSASTHLSACEQRSTKCERQFYAIKKARFMVPHLGKEFDGIISSVAKFGIFVLLREFDVDGLIKIDDLGFDRFEFDEDNLRLVGKKTGQAFEIGMPLTVQVANADIESGRVDFLIAGQEARKASKEDVSNKREFKAVNRNDNQHQGRQKREVAKHRKTNRSHNKKRGKAEDDSWGVRKARVRKRR